MDPFKWHPDEDPPPIEEHSKAKLDVLRSYLRAYFDRLGRNLAREEFRLDLVDGFAGGGTFLDGNETVSGTPLIMLEESEKARERLGRGRRKPLRFDCKYYFIDVKPDHTDHLRKVLQEYGHHVDGERIVVRNSAFAEEVDGIVAEIQRRQPRAGRSIFLLDQKGYGQVELALVARIFRKLPAAEVILTFAADTLINFLDERPAFINGVAPLELTKKQIRDMIAFQNGDGGKALVQRVLRWQIRSRTQAIYDTPFFIRPEKSRRALWFLHLSRHPTARDVMIQCHWNATNTFDHYGTGDFKMLGWEALESRTLPLFRFGRIDEERMREQLLSAMPDKLFSLASDEPVTVDAVRHTFANETAARFSDLDEVILALHQGREVNILDTNGKVRRRSLAKLGATDRIAFPATLFLPGFSRLGSIPQQIKVPEDFDRMGRCEIERMFEGDT